MRILSLLAGVLLLAPAAGDAAPRQIVEGIAVRVNDRILTVSEMRTRIEERAPGAMDSLTREQAAALLQEVADEMCLLERAAELKIDVTADDVSRALRQLREENHAQDDAEFEAMLRASGMTVERLRQRIRESMMVNYVMSREIGTIPLTEEELRQRYARDREMFRVPEQVHLHHLILNLNVDRSDEEARLAEARRLAAAARSGQDFLALVDDEVQRGGSSGGDLGTIAIGDLRSEVATVVANLQSGQVSEPFTSPAGVHVVKLVDRVPPSFRPFADVVEEVREQELEDRYRVRLQEVVERVKTRYVVETFPELLL